MKIAFLYADSTTEWNCSNWRCLLLANAINAAHEKSPRRFPHTAALYFMPTALNIHHPAVQAKLGAADVQVWQRNVIDTPMWDSMEYWRALGKIVIADLDDHYPLIPPSNPAYPYWILNQNEFDPTPVARLTEGLKHADALISPSKVILEDWKGIVPGYWWPNYPTLPDYENLLRREPGDPDILFSYKMTDGKPEWVIEHQPNTAGRIVIGWGGSISHVDSFFYSSVVEGMARLMQENPNVYFKFCGHDERLKFMLDKLPEGRVIRQIGVDPTHWPQVLGTFDIGIAPLDMRECESVVGDVTGYSYDERRSWLKLVEYICAGVPFVATDAAPYHELGKYGKLVPNTAEAWYEALKARADSLPTFYAQAMETRKYGLKKLTIEANAERLVTLYTRIGEETQARRLGAKLPGVLYVEPEKVVA